MDYLIYAAIAVAGYLFGSISFAIVIGKLFYNTDVRQHGSKSAGATNVLRNLGKKAAILVTIGDVSKGIIAYLIGGWIGSFTANPQLAAVIGGFGAILGHNYPVYFKFKGGKGVLTSLALAFMLDWRASVIALVVFAIVVLTTRYVSLGSLIATFTDVMLIYFFNPNDPISYITGFLACILIFIKHKANIKRLITKTESKIF